MTDRTVSRPVCPVVRRPSGTRDQFFFLLQISFRQLRVCYFAAPSLMRGILTRLHTELEGVGSGRLEGTIPNAV
jgi:hypothetical protein